MPRPFPDADSRNGMLSLFFKHLEEEIWLSVKRVKVVEGGTEALWDHSTHPGRGLKPAGDAPSTIQLAEAATKNVR